MSGGDAAIEDKEASGRGATGGRSGGPGVYQIVEAGILGVAFAVIYAFGIVRFAGAVSQVWGRAAGIGISVFAVVIAVAFVDAVSRVVSWSRASEDEAGS
jgi:hypothetical protein